MPSYFFNSWLLWLIRMFECEFVFQSYVSMFNKFWPLFQTSVQMLQVADACVDHKIFTKCATACFNI